MTDAFRILIVTAGFIAGISEYGEHRPDLESIGRTCAAFAVWTEARGEPLRGQVAVAEVILARQASPDYPEDLCEIVMEPDQFHGVRDWPRSRRPWELDPDGWDSALYAVDGVFLGELSSGCKPGAIHFFRGETPAWARSLPVHCEIAGHRFVGPAGIDAANPAGGSR